ncbi:AraC family transcriptional regulator [Flavobacterium turcicum]|uniref:AraC family transcriptional regulator n=1 Tax=Flavobacterium turcicum TaxID=2764718 RepID=A0ABR7JEW4_9FLAO|nr:AraC family transcriptional regulator [Flavobacterium turcicum]MBC5862855.1 AraC family transcriptional regulator [Flavobacterium turcicum]NHL01587.1 AraC family transcriptional regulator [Flavobacterium turcicum]
MIKKKLLIVTLCIVKFTYAQEIKFQIPDSLQNKDFDYLFEQIESSQQDEKKQALYLNSFLYKAKAEKNAEEIVNGYKNYIYYAPENLRLVYADSMIYSAQRSKDNALIGSAYLSKGIEYYAQKKHNYALDNYLIANNFISKTNDKYLIYKVKYNIASIKYYLGFYDEAISLFNECITFFKQNNDRAYLNSLHSLGLCYNKTGNYGLCTETNEKGISEGKRLKNDEMKNYFIHSEGINQYFKSNYTLAIQKISDALPNVIKNKDFANESVGYFYIGKSYLGLKKIEIALSYFKKVDEIFENKNYIRPDLRENYEILINYYKSKKDLKIQLFYIGKLLKADSIINTKYKYLSKKIYKEYDTKKLLLDKTRIENSLNNRKYNDFILISVIAILFISLLFITYFHIRNKNLYRQKFEELMSKSEENTKTETKISTRGIEDINESTVASILKQLEKFEKDKKFLEKDLTAVKLTVAFGSNAKYLSKIIFHYRGKKFVDYINDLKIDYITSSLKEDKRMRNYTNKALAEEAGFSSTQRFATAFFSKTGMPTSYFIDQLKKEQTQIENLKTE